MLKRIQKYISANHLLGKSALHIVALSGGADSVCLLRVMLQLGYDVHAAHCNFHLRGQESNRDEAFCIQLCKELDVPLHLTHFDTKTYAGLHKVSIEMAARELRYDYFEQLRIALEAEDIIVAHHSDDNIETILMNLMRGTGIHGLEGIKPRNGRIIRPLLCISRDDIIQYLTHLSQPYVTDSTNLIDDVTRNKVRLNLIPLLLDINPSAKENILHTAQNIAEVVKVVDHATQTSVEECSRQNVDGTFIIYKEKLASQPSPEQTLFALLTPYHFSPQQIRQIHERIDVATGRTWQSSTHTIASDRGAFIVQPNRADDALPVVTIPEDGIYIYKGDARLKVETCQRDTNFKPSTQPLCATLDAQKVRFPLTLRPAMPGDRFRPYGMKGTKLISDYLTDRKRNYFEKQRQLVLTDASGDILWLIGERVSQKASCDDSTIKILTMRYLG